MPLITPEIEDKLPKELKWTLQFLRDISRASYVDSLIIGVAVAFVYDGAMTSLMFIYSNNQILGAISKFGSLAMGSLGFVISLLVHRILYNIPPNIQRQLDTI
jgi:hypothetical protein